MSFSTKPYQLAIVCGDSQISKANDLADTVISLYPETFTEEGLVKAVEQSKLTPGDLKSTTVVLMDTAPGGGVVLWAFLCGFSSRVLPCAEVASETLIDPVDIIEAAKNLADTGKPDTKPEHVDYYPGSDLFLSPEGVGAARWAKKATLHSSGNTLMDIGNLCALIGVRRREDHRFFPGYKADADAETVLLERVKGNGGALRRDMLFDLTIPIAEKKELTAQQKQLIEAANTPIEATLYNLKTHEHDAFWHCPRPENHNNGDRNPSTRVKENKVMCARCDKEYIDSLRLVTEVLQINPNEAAMLLLDKETDWTNLRPDFDYHPGE